MNIVRELEALKGLVMDRKSVDLKDRIYFRNLITQIINEVKAEGEKERAFDLPEWLKTEDFPLNVTIKREDIE